MNERELLALLGIIESVFELANERARRAGSYRPEDHARERDLDDRLLRLREKLLADLRGNLVQAGAEAHLTDAVPLGSA